jgi:hypothetical protein
MKVFIATPAYNGQVTTSYMSSVMSLPLAGVAVQWTSVDDSLISRARNTLVTRFLESGTEHLLFIEADIGFDPSQVVAVLELRQEFVAGAAPVKDYFPDGLRYAATPCPAPERDASGRFITAEHAFYYRRTCWRQPVVAQKNGL